MNLSLALNLDYDICSPLIRCHADKIGARVFTASNGYGGILRILAFTEEEAGKLASQERGYYQPEFAVIAQEELIT